MPEHRRRHICGIVAVVGKVGANEERAFKMLLELDTIRGPHSTGVLSVTRNGSTEVTKAVGTPWDLYDSKKFDTMFGHRTHVCLLGHNRFATKGSITPKNAHPFTHGDITGVHNGTLTNQSLLEDYRQFDVDSDNLFYHLNMFGVDDTVSKLDGAFALAWYDKSEHTFNMARNAERPLSYCLSEDGLTCFVASEAWMLSVVLSKHTIKHNEPVHIKPGEYHYFTITDETAQKDMKPIDAYFRNLELHKKKVWQPNPSTTTASTTTARATGTGTGTTGGTVTSIEDARNKRTPETAVALLSDYVGQWVEVACDKTVRGGSGKRKYCYVRSETEDAHGVEVRIHCDYGSALQTKLMSSPHLFRVKITGFNTYGAEGFLNVQQGSVQELTSTSKVLIAEQETDDAPKEGESCNLAVYTGHQFIGYQGKALTYDQFRYAARNGCCCCADPLDMKDNAKIEWVYSDEYVCPGCLNTKDETMATVVEMARREMSKSSVH